MSELKVVPVAQITPAEEALRDVDVNTEEFLGLVESVRQIGIRLPINIREIGQDRYEIIDGLQRFTAAKIVGLTDVPCHITPLESDDALLIQIQTNAHHIDTKPIEYSQALLRILERNPALTLGHLAKLLSKTEQWVRRRLDLLKLVPEAATAVDSGKIRLSNAYQLTKIPADEQSSWVDAASNDTPGEFEPKISSRRKEINEARRVGRTVEAREFKPIPILRKRSEIHDEVKYCSHFEPLCDGLTSPHEIWQRALQWSLNLDPVSVEMQRAKEEERLAEHQRKKEQAREERHRRRAELVQKGREMAQKEINELSKDV